MTNACVCGHEAVYHEAYDGATVCSGGDDESPCGCPKFRASSPDSAPAREASEPDDTEGPRNYLHRYLRRECGFVPASSHTDGEP